MKDTGVPKNYHSVSDVYTKLVNFIYCFIKGPRLGLASIRSEFWSMENVFHRRRIQEYDNYIYSLERAVIIALDSDPSRTSSILAETEKVVKHIMDRMSKYDQIPIPASYDADICLAKLCYTLCRLLSPTTIVETGVARGITTAFILHALEKNNRGHLYSIDIPSLHMSHLYIGIAVPQRLKYQWTLILDDSLHFIPKIRKKIDIFLHDSDHSYRHQLIEYRLAWKNLRPGGILISDDVHNSDAFIEFAETVKVQPIIIKQQEKMQQHLESKNGRIGLLVKPYRIKSV